MVEQDILKFQYQVAIAVECERMSKKAKRMGPTTVYSLTYHDKGNAEYIDFFCLQTGRYVWQDGPSGTKEEPSREVYRAYASHNLDALPLADNLTTEEALDFVACGTIPAGKMFKV